MSERYSIIRLCLLAKVARSSYYKWLKRKDIITNKDIQDKIIKNHILDIHNKYRGTYGRKRICIYLNNILGIEINHKRVYRLMNEMNIKAVIVNVNLKMLKSSNMKMHNYLIVICFLVGSFHIHLLFYKMAQLF